MSIYIITNYPTLTLKVETKKPPSRTAFDASLYTPSPLPPIAAAGGGLPRMAFAVFLGAAPSRAQLATGAAQDTMALPLFGRHLFCRFALLPCPFLTFLKAILSTWVIEHYPPLAVTENRMPKDDRIGFNSIDGKNCNLSAPCLYLRLTIMAHRYNLDGPF